MAAVNKAKPNVISWNINGMKSKKDRFDILMKNKQFDIVLLQETKLGEKKKVEDVLAGMNSMEIRSESEEGQSDLENEYEEGQSESENEDEEEDLTAGKKRCSGSKEGQSESEYEVKKQSKEEDIEEEVYVIKDLTTHQTYQGPNKIQQRIMYTANLHSRSRGVAILVNKQHKCLKAYSEYGDFAWVYIEIDDQKYTFVSVYYHRDERDLMSRIHQSFLTHEPQWTKSKLVIGGDFNTTLVPSVDLEKRKENQEHTPRRVKMDKFIRDVKLEGVKLIDVWRRKNGPKKQFTYSCKRHISRLDYVFMLERDYQYVQTCEIPNEVEYTMSDHYPVVLTMQFKNE
ncbi:hypothetical protein E1301_Tti023044 [Triplophysa tibetana]|uniref:exodeoxyribonuclease III n=1 Tax=Triplophysa tibetana TaxID=1572043 RepID=A0A5A9NMB7_9TELE|nr:hypothetical protein E1301_Tti023044 [Triplophysa tibetana]